MVAQDKCINFASLRYSEAICLLYIFIYIYVYIYEMWVLERAINCDRWLIYIHIYFIGHVNYIVINYTYLQLPKRAHDSTIYNLYIYR